MTVRINMQMSDDLDKAISDEANTRQTTKSEVMRKALQLYLAAAEGQRKGKKIGLVDPATDKIETEFVGL